MNRYNHLALLSFIGKWLLISLFIGGAVGSASAFFLESLHWATDLREANKWIIWFLPVGGLAVGLLYHYFGKSVEGGNNQLIEEVQQPKKIIPVIMAPFVLFGTVVTHLFGGSAGREGTAVQMGGAIADQLSFIIKPDSETRKVLLAAGISAGFASVFGTPLAGAVFGLEMAVINKLNYKAIIPCFLSAVLANYVTTAWGVPHTHYAISSITEVNLPSIGYMLVAALCFGLAGLTFSVLTKKLGGLYSKYIKYAPLRPFIGGLIIALLVLAVGHTRYIGLGVPTIVDAFTVELPSYDFLAKIIFTAITLGAGYKGGEVTPLFFVGATLGNALSGVIPLPMDLLVGCGFVAVFAAAANTPLACILMGIELFGSGSSTFIGIACVVAFLFSSHTGIYKNQLVGFSKGMLKGTDDKKLNDY